MAATCDPCLGGKHFRCARDGCSCSICLLKRKPRLRARELEPVPPAVADQDPEELQFKKGVARAQAARKTRDQYDPKPKVKPARRYDEEIVRQARDMKSAGATWAEIASHFSVPKEGIRYAVLHYEALPPEAEVKRVSVTRNVDGVFATLILNEEELAEAHLAVSDLATSVQRAASDLEGDAYRRAQQRVAVLVSLQTAFAEAQTTAAIVRKGKEDDDGGS